MPEALEAPPVQANAEPEFPKGIDEAMKAFIDVTTPKPKETPAATPKTEPAKPDAPKPDAAPVIDPKTPAKPEDLWEKAPGKLKGEHFKTVRVLEDKIATAEKRIKEIESKRVEAPGDNKLVEQYQKQVKELEQRLAATDYRQSADFQKQFTNRINAAYKDSVSEIASLKISMRDADGNITQRPAVEEDFRQIFGLKGAAQDEAIAAFGTSAYRVAAMARELMSLSRQADLALQEHATNAEKTAQEQALAKQTGDQTYKNHYDASVAELEKSWPQYFAPDEKDPEASDALKQGYKFVDDIAANQDAFTPDQRAAYNAVVRARAAGFARAILDGNRKDAKIKSLEEELSKFRSSDPGAAGERSGAGATAGDEDVPKGIEAAAKAFSNLK